MLQALPKLALSSNYSYFYLNPSHTEIFRNIKGKYGADVTALARKYVKSAMRIARHKEHLTFNHRCRRYGIVPPFLRVKPLVRNTLGMKVAERSSHQFLAALIGKCHTVINGVGRMKSIMDHLVNVLNPTEVEDLKVHTSRAQEITTQKSRTAQKAKFDRLLKKNAPPNSRWVVNLSSKKLNPNEEAVLKKGMNFAVTPGRIPVEDVITGVEGGLQGLTGSEVDKARLKIAGVLTSAKPPPSNLPWSFQKALNDLKKEEDIVILPADKGRCTVVMDKSEYQDKVNSLLEDRKFYKVLKKDPTSSTEREMNATLLKLKKEGTIPEPLYHKLRSSGGHIPLLYGLPKIHKPGIPLRPIVSFVSSPTYALSRYLARVLSPLVGNSSSFVASSSEFVNFSKTVTIPDNYELVSFDVVSLFTNVPIELALSVVEKRLDEMDVSDHTPLSKEVLVSLLRLSVVYQLLLQWDCVPADLWDSNGITGVSCCGKHSHGIH